MALSAPGASAAPPGSATTTRPLFGGYVLVALVTAWLAGIAVEALIPVRALGPLGWLGVALVAGAVWLAAGLRGRRATSRWTTWWRAALMVGMLACALALGCARAAWTDPTGDPHSIARLVPNGAQVRVRGSVATEPDLRDGARLLTLDVSGVSFDGGHSWRNTTGRIEATWLGADDWFAPAYGDSLQLTGTLVSGADGAPSGVVARLTKAHGTITARGGGNPLVAWLFGVRLALAQAIQHTVPEPEAALLIGILLGLKTPTLRSRLALFTATGTIHLVVPAGLKVAVLATLASRALGPLGRWPRIIGAILAVAGYAALGGGGPAALRAAIMGTVLVLAPALGRTYNVFTSLALAVFIMTAAEPLVVYDAGFQLTTLATLGLPLLVPRIQPRLSVLLRWARIVPFAEGIAESLAVTLAAQLAALPVLALTFHEVSLVAPLANLITVPLLAPLLALGGLLALLALAGQSVALLGGAALALAWLVWPLLAYVDGAIALCATLPAAALAVTGTPVALAWGYYALLAGLYWGAPPLLRRWRGRGRAVIATPPTLAPSGHGARHGLPGRRIGLALLLAALLAACGAAVPAMAAGTRAHLDVLDVGPGGAATLLRLPSGVSVLFDGGPSGPALQAALTARLPFYRRTLDLALLTDPRPGYARGLTDATAHYTFAHAADAGMLHPSADYTAWLDALQRARTPTTRIRQGNSIQLDATSRLSVLAPPQQLYPPHEGDATASNDLILRLDTPGLRVLLLGAADAYALDALAGSGESLTADVVTLALVPGAPLALDGPLGDVLAAAHPRLVVIADAPLAPGTAAERAAQQGATGPTDDEAATQLGALIYRTSAAGTVSLSGGAGGWTLGG